MKIYRLSFLILAALSLGCSKDDAEYIENPQFDLRVPANFPEPPEFPDNPLTTAGVALGEKLFFDSKLSGDNNISCATCHKPELAFSESSALSTKGISGKPLLRHVPTLVNLAWSQNGFFWDGGSKNLESQAFAPLAHEDEMFQDLQGLEEELKADLEYIELFENAFHSEIKINLVMKALAQYQRSLIFADSKYDKYIRNENDVELNQQELRGYSVYLDNCALCHQSDLFTDDDYHNNGLDATFLNFSNDEIFLGRYRVTRSPDDIGKYKTPTLRNVAITAPYMHDGRFNSLKEVLDFYNSGVQESETLDPLLIQNNKIGIELNADDQEALLAFLNTLTDSKYL